MGVPRRDKTILHALQRELFEETGLVMSKVVDILDGSVEFQWGEGICRKATFLAEVEDIGSVVLIPEEHADFVWATEEDVEWGVCEGRAMRFAYVRRWFLKACRGSSEETELSRTHSST